MPKPGILWVNSKITHPDAITDERFNEWYDEVHIRDVLATSGIASAFRYKSIDPQADRPYLALYPVSDVNWLGGDEFKSIPMTSDYFPAPSHACIDYVHFDARFYEFIHAYEQPGAVQSTKGKGPAKLIISVALTPAEGTDQEIDKWYREEHYGTLAECPGYVRTRRYKLKTAAKADNPTEYLALHEFERDTLPQAELEKAADTPWAKKIMASLQGAEMKVFALSRAFGDVNGKI